MPKQINREWLNYNEKHINNFNNYKQLTNNS